MGFAHTSNWHVYTPDGRKKYLDANQRGRFIEAAALEPEAVGALCLFLIFCGCRISEALSLTTASLDLAGKTVLLRTLKRRKLAFREIPLPTFMVEMLLHIGPADGPVWPIHRVTAWRWVTRVMERARICGPMACCRGTRHTFAIHAAKTNVPPGLIQKWLGHADLATTMIYLEAAGLEEREFAERMW